MSAPRNGSHTVRALPALCLGLAMLSGSAAQTAAGQSTTAPAAEPAQAPPGTLPVGAIVAFSPRFGAAYRDTAELRTWLARQGWAICDGSGGTPDLRDRMLLGTTDPSRTGERLGSRRHAHRLRGETGSPVRRNRSTPTGRLRLEQIPDDQHRHRLDLESDDAAHLPPSTRVLFIMRMR